MIRILNIRATCLSYQLKSFSIGHHSIFDTVSSPFIRRSAIGTFTIARGYKMTSLVALTTIGMIAAQGFFMCYIIQGNITN
jgi:hypothetical protein